MVFVCNDQLVDCVLIEVSCVFVKGSDDPGQPRFGPQCCPERAAVARRGTQN